VNAKPAFPVLAHRCDQCLFGPNKIVTEERKAEVLATVQAEEGHFTCHKATLAGKDVCCRGFYDAMTTIRVRLAGMLGLTVFVAEGDL
jgi:hypothetical protein